SPDRGEAARLRGFLDELEGLHRGGDWGRLARRHAEVVEQADGVLTGVRAERDGLRELLDRRAELRGRLDAYRAKAGKSGHGENLALVELHRVAHDLLWAAPCDLGAATRAVAAYSAAVNTAVKG
ncbi:MAG TPA: serine protease, partial [Pseudonocardiaceae bacterium]